jgi:hypothetical protein
MEQVILPKLPGYDHKNRLVIKRARKAIDGDAPTSYTKAAKGLPIKLISASNPKISLEKKQKICQLLAVDYCCLNFPLPTECESVVTCQWVQKNNSNDDLMIETISPYPPPIVSD